MRRNKNGFPTICWAINFRIGTHRHSKNIYIYSPAYWENQLCRFLTCYYCVKNSLVSLKYDPHIVNNSCSKLTNLLQAFIPVQYFTTKKYEKWSIQYYELWYVISIKTSGQSYKASTNVNHDSRVIPDLKIPIIRL